jgi:uncharacterized protein with HEPN domain
MNRDRSDAATYIWEALEAAQRIARFTLDKSYKTYLDDEMLRSAVERQFAIIGEAFAALRRVDAEAAATIPELSRIVAFRNILIHAYFGIDHATVWGVVENDLTDLIERLSLILSEDDSLD